MKKFMSLFLIMFMLLVGTYSVSAAEDVVAKIGDVEYNDLLIALNSANEGETVDLLKDVTLDYQYPDSVATMKDGVVFDLNEHTITLSSMRALVFYGNNLVIKNGTFSSTENYSFWYGASKYEGDVLSGGLVEDVVVKTGLNIYNTDGLVLRNVTATGKKYYAVWSDKRARVIIESGNFSTTGSKALLGSNTHPIEVKGGNFKMIKGSTKVPLALTGNYVLPVLTGGTFDRDFSSYVKDGYTLIKESDTKFVVKREANILLDENKGGNVTVPEKMLEGEEVSIDVELDDASLGYILKVFDEEGNKIDVVDNKFIMPSKEVTVKVKYLKDTIINLEDEKEVNKFIVTLDDSDGIIDNISSSMLENSLYQELVKENNIEVLFDINSVDSNNKELSNLNSVIGEGYDVSYFDFSIRFMDADDGKELGLLSEVLDDIVITLKLPDEFINKTDREYKLLRSHDGMIDELPFVISEDGRYITFNSSKFSVYALALEEIEEVVKGEIDNKEDEDVPKTFDSLSLYIVLAVLSIVVIGGTVIYQVKKNK